jgi:HEAT repeat protein
MSESKDILELLQSDEPEVLREAAFRAGETGNREAISALVGLLKSGNLGVQEAADNALRILGGKETVRNMVPLLESDDAPVRNLAMDILREVGNQDFVTLTELLHNADPDLRIFASDILGSTSNLMAVGPLCESLLKDPEVNVRYQAAVSLGNLSMPEAAECLDKSLDDDEWVLFAVIEALSKIGADSSVAAMVKRLDTCSDLVASMIVEALGEIGNIKAVTMLLRRLEKSPTALRNKIVQAIVKILGGKSLTLLSEGERENFRQYLLVALKDEDTAIQDDVIRGLAYVGGDEASNDVARLASQMNVEREPERIEAAIDTLAKIGLTKSLVTNAIQNESPERARIAIEVLARIPSEEVTGILIEAFSGKGRDLQREIVQALIASAGDEAASFFMEQLDSHEDGTVIKGALHFLGQKIRYAPAEEILFSFLDHPWNDVKEAALEACIGLGTESMPRRFVELVSDEDPMHRLMGVYALGKLNLREHVDLLKQSLEDEVPDIRKVALESLAEICGFSNECLEMVVRRLYDENSEVRLSVVELLGRSGETRTVPYMLQALNDDDDWVRIRAMEALASSKAREATPKLVEMLESNNKLIVFKVIESLGEIGGQAAFRALLEVSGGEDPELMEAAEEAVQKIQLLGEEA